MRLCCMLHWCYCSRLLFTCHMCNAAPLHDMNAAAVAGINLGLAYQRCAQKAQARSKVRREQALSKLSMPDGRWPVFGRAARKQIPAAVIDRIRWG